MQGTVCCLIEHPYGAVNKVIRRPLQHRPGAGQSLAVLVCFPRPLLSESEFHLCAVRTGRCLFLTVVLSPRRVNHKVRGVGKEGEGHKITMRDKHPHKRDTLDSIYQVGQVNGSASGVCLRFWTALWTARGVYSGMP